MHERVAVVIPSLGNPSLTSCISALSAQTQRPDRIIVVLSGGSSLPVTEFEIEIETIISHRRLGFAAAVNRGLREIGDSAPLIALLNDDAVPATQWLETLARALQHHRHLGAVQGTVTDAGDPPLVDGRGLALTSFGLAVQVDRFSPANDSGRSLEYRLGVSATAALYKSSALQSVRLRDGSVFDESFDCYHEDTDLALRLNRVGHQAAWVPGAPCRHLGSASGGQRPWRHPWWILANRWRALAGNLTPAAFVLAFPRLMRGEIRAVRTLNQTNPRALLVAVLVLLTLPLLKIKGWLRKTPGARLDHIPRGRQ